jgi:Fe-S-cluster containining protein
MTSLLLPILSPSQCSSCKFCCSFAEFEAWEAPLFSAQQIKTLTKKYGPFSIKSVGNAFTLDFTKYYESHSDIEHNAYAPCPFLSDHGCILTDEEKPFDCKIWPLRIMHISKENRTVLALTPTCVEINKLPIEDIRYFVETSRIMQAIANEAKKLPEIIKEYREGFPILGEY